MPGAAPPARLRWLYTRAQICRTFPGYKLSDLDHEPIIPLLQAMQLLDAAHKVLNPPKG